MTNSERPPLNAQPIHFYGAHIEHYHKNSRWCSVSTFQARKINRLKTTPNKQNTMRAIWTVWFKLRCFHSCASTSGLRWDNIYRLYEHIIKFNAICNCAFFRATDRKLSFIMWSISNCLQLFVCHPVARQTKLWTRGISGSFSPLHQNSAPHFLLSSKSFMRIIKSTSNSNEMYSNCMKGCGLWNDSYAIGYTLHIRHSLERWMHWISNILPNESTIVQPHSFKTIIKMMISNRNE